MNYDITEILLIVGLETITLTLYNFYFPRKIRKKLNENPIQRGSHGFQTVTIVKCSC